MRTFLKKWAERLIARTTRRPPDIVIGGNDRPYMHRWYLLGARPKKIGDKLHSKTIMGMSRPYLHRFMRSDDDRALHDHPAASLSIALRGHAIEHTIAAGGIHQRHMLRAGQIRYRSAKFTHRIEIEPGTEFWTLFIFFRNTRNWGFHCKRGWMPWQEFTAANDSGEIGQGCGD